MFCFRHRWLSVLVPELLLTAVVTRGGKLHPIPTIGTWVCEKCGKRKIDFFDKVPPALLLGKAHHWLVGIPLSMKLSDTVIQIIDEAKYETAFEYALKLEKPKPTLVKG